MRTIFLAVPYAVAVRDILRSETFDVLCGNPQVNVVVFAPEGDLEDISREFARPRVRFEPLRPFSVSFAERLLYHFNRALLHRSCRTIQLGNTGGMTWAFRGLIPVARLTQAVAGERRTWKAMSWCFRHASGRKMYREQFTRYRPDLVVVSRVLNFSMDYPLMKHAEVENVPVIVLVSSWDNLTSKGFFAFEATRLIVWNEVMKSEATDLFHYPPERVWVSGIPRFDVFFRSELSRTKEEFLRLYGLDPRRKVVTYATGSATTGVGPKDVVSPEPEIADFLADVIRDGLIPNAQLVVRLHPQASPSQYHRLVQRPDVVVDIPGKSSSFVDRLFSQSDDESFAALMKHSDVVVNLFSTVMLDAVACDTPTVGINFDFRGQRPLLQSVKRMAQFDHNAKLLATGCARLAGSREELIDLIGRYLSDRTIDAAQRRQARDLYCVYTDGSAGRRVGALVLQALQTTSPAAAEML